MNCRKPLRRIALVRFSPQGSAYPTDCPRPDLQVGDAVEVTMRAGQPDEHFLKGVITAIRHQRWACSCKTLYRASEVESGWAVDEASGEWTFVRRVLGRVSTEREEDLADWSTGFGRMEQDGGPSLHELYEAMGEGNGAPLYLNDGVWLSAGGRVYED